MLLKYLRTHHNYEKLILGKLRHGNFSVEELIFVKIFIWYGVTCSQKLFQIYPLSRIHVYFVFFFCILLCNNTYKYTNSGMI